MVLSLLSEVVPTTTVKVSRLLPAPQMIGGAFLRTEREKSAIGRHRRVQRMFKGTDSGLSQRMARMTR